MFDIIIYLLKQLIVGVFEQLIERRQVWRTKFTVLATAKKRIDSPLADGGMAVFSPLYKCLAIKPAPGRTQCRHCRLESQQKSAPCGDRQRRQWINDK